MTATDTTYAPPQARPFADPELVPDLAALFKRFVVLPSDQHAIVLALWVIHTWTIEHSRTTPYLYVFSDEPGCAKTLLIEVLELLVRNPLRAASMTSAVLFRAINTYQPTLLWDEIDTIFNTSRNEVTRSVVNVGYKRGNYVLRIHQGQPHKFDAFCPKVLAGINNGFMPETITDRAIPFKMKPRAKGQQIERFYQGEVARSPEVEDLLARIEGFTKTWARELRMLRPEPITSISDRQWEITEPLVALGCCFGAEQRVRDACEAMFRDTKKPPSPQKQLMDDLRAVFGDDDRMFSDDVCTLLGPTWSQKQLSVWLEPYGIHPQGIRIGNQTRKGYYKHQFEEAWNA